MHLESGLSVVINVCCSTVVVCRTFSRDVAGTTLDQAYDILFMQSNGKI